MPPQYPVLPTEEDSFDTRRSIAMATDTDSCIAQIGETAGEIWQVLTIKGPLTIAKLVKEVDAPRDVLMQALGWLAREDKIVIEEDARTRVVSLR
jgi:winged helix-turn-helix protein DUF2582